MLKKVHPVPHPTTTLSSLSQAFLPSLLINEGKPGRGGNHPNAREAASHGSWCFEGRVVRTACVSGSKSHNRTSSRESWNRDRDRDSAQRHLTLQTQRLLPIAAALGCFFCLCLSLRAGMLMLLAVTGSKHRRSTDRSVKSGCQNKSILCQCLF